jgi:hypothetical protein
MSIKVKLYKGIIWSSISQTSTDLVNTILDFFPDEQSNVHSCKYITSELK